MRSRIRITMLSNTKGGVFSFTTHLTRMLTCRDCFVKIIFLSQPTKKNNEENLEIDYLVTSKGLPNFRALANFLFCNDSDIVHINFASFIPLALFKKLVFKTPFILTLHGLPQPYLSNAWRNKIQYLIESLMIPFAAKYASATVVVSNYIKRALRVRYGLDSYLIHHGINSSGGVKIENKNVAKRQLGFAEKDFIILFVGYLNPYKDPLTLIRAFHQLVHVHNSHLIIVGTGELFEEVGNTVRRLCLQNNVSLLGNISEEELTLCYNAADIFVLSTVNEAFGIVLLEAMAHGLPIVCSASGACPEVVGNAGLYFKQGDPTDLANSIARLMQDRKLLQKLGQKGFDRVNKFFSLKDEANQYWNLFRREGACQLMHEQSPDVFPPKSEVN